MFSNAEFEMLVSLDSPLQTCYYICTVTLENFNLSHVPVYIMSQDQLAMYSTYMRTLGNRPDLFPGSSYVNRYGTGHGSYGIPPHGCPTNMAVMKMRAGLLSALEVQKGMNCRGHRFSAGSHSLSAKAGFSQRKK